MTAPTNSTENARTTLPYGSDSDAELTRITYLTAVVVLVFSLFMLLRLVEMLQQVPSLTLYYSGNSNLWSSLVATFINLANSAAGVVMGVASLGVLNRSTAAKRWVARCALIMLGLIIAELFLPPFSFWTIMVNRQKSEGLLGLLSAIDAVLYIELPHSLMLILVFVVMNRGRLK